MENKKFLVKFKNGESWVEHKILKRFQVIKELLEVFPNEKQIIIPNVDKKDFELIENFIENPSN